MLCDASIENGHPTWPPFDRTHKRFVFRTMAFDERATKGHAAVDNLLNNRSWRDQVLGRARMVEVRLNCHVALR